MLSASSHALVPRLSLTTSRSLIWHRDRPEHWAGFNYYLSHGSGEDNTRADMHPRERFRYTSSRCINEWYGLIQIFTETIRISTTKLWRVCPIYHWRQKPAFGGTVSCALDVPRPAILYSSNAKNWIGLNAWNLNVLRAGMRACEHVRVRTSSVVRARVCVCTHARTRRTERGARRSVAWRPAFRKHRLVGARCKSLLFRMDNHGGRKRRPRETC